MKKGGFPYTTVGWNGDNDLDRNHKNTGFRIKSGMTSRMGLTSPCTVMEKGEICFYLFGVIDIKRYKRAGRKLHVEFF